MPRILGVDIPNDKSIWVSLTYIYGVGVTSSRKVLAELQIDPSMKARDVGEEELARLAAYIETNFSVEGQLRRQRMQDIGRLKDIGCYRGLRHRRGLPVRGHRT
ncbi:MAG TPA: 30S ribosomal protein S13, partial [Planctomycetota bacterium]|nr:30S ribosomal protein S13 [Planctomycetota bacterium]